MVRRFGTAALAALASVAGAVPFAPTPAAHAAGFVARVNFQPQAATIPAGYQKDFGEAFSEARGYGWVAQNSSTPLSIVGNGRERNASSDQRLDTFMHMQYNGTDPGSVAVQARWEQVLATGSYDVTVTVGDATAVDSVDRVTVEGIVAIDNFAPTGGNKFATRTVRVTVTDGRLTLDSAGGTNTKIDYVDIATASAPTIVDSDPRNGEVGVEVTTSVSLNPSRAVDPNTVGPATIKLLDPSNTQVAGSYNTDAAGGIVSFTPRTRLEANSRYSVQSTSGLKDDNGVSFAPFASSFTTGTGGLPPLPFAFNRSTVDGISGPTVVTLGPDGKLYVATSVGQILRYTLGPDGMATGNPQSLGPFANQRTILGLRFDPRSTATNLMLWVSHGFLGFQNVPNFTGKISLLTGPNLATARDVIVGLPRSVKDHMNNGVEFGPDGKLYIAQGSVSGFGAPDPAWGNRAEVPMSATILVADVMRDPRFNGTVDVDTDAGYNVGSVNAPVKIYAFGIRNPYDLVWHSNGNLYAPVNEAANGNAPAGPNGNPPALYDLPAGRDYLAKVRPGRYFGHPNPSYGHYVLNGGNPTAGADYFETPQYPVGVLPDPVWDRPALDLGLHRSADGVVEYKSAAFGGGLRGKLLIAEFSNGDDIVAVGLDGAGNVTGESQLASGFTNPLDVTANNVNGNLYVAEYGAPADGSGGKITLLKPNIAPLGRADGISSTSGGAAVRGWAIDPDSSTPTRVQAVVDGTPRSSFVAGGSRPDVAAAFPGYGAAHGFSAVVAVGSGAHTVCLDALDLTTGPGKRLGCGTVLVPSNPIGSVDVLRPASATSVSIGGWAADPDAPTASIPVHVYVDGRFAVATTASANRADIGALFVGYGAAHGYLLSVPMGYGTHTVCVYGINTGPGTNSPLTCRSVTLSGDPIGHFDAATRRPGGMAVSGWSIDPDTTGPNTVHVYVDGRFAGSGTANKTRSDIGAAFPNYGTNHGFSVTVAAAAGSHAVCAYGINVSGGGGNRALGCRTVALSGTPVGHLDAVLRSTGQAQVRGWAIDPDTTQAVQVHVYVDGRFAGSTTANVARPDVGDLYTGYGDDHGYVKAVPADESPHTFCAYAINVGGGSNALLGCREA